MSACLPTCIPVIRSFAAQTSPIHLPAPCPAASHEAQRGLRQPSHSSSTLSCDKNRKWLMNPPPKHCLIKSVSSLKGANLPSTIASLLHRRQQQLNRTFNISPLLCGRREQGMFRDFNWTHGVDTRSKHNGLLTPHVVYGSSHPSILTQWTPPHETTGILGYF